MSTPATSPIKPLPDLPADVAACGGPACAVHPAARGARGARLIARTRPAIQLAVLAIVLAPAWWPALRPGLPFYWGNFAAGQLHVGSLTVPLADPFTALTSMAAAVSAPATLLCGAGLVLGFYLLVRARAFCAIACPMHLVLETSDRLLRRWRLAPGGIGGMLPRWLNVALAAMLVGASALAGLPVFEPFNPVNALVRALQNFAFAGLGLVAAVLLLEAIAGRRVFCRHVCPVGGFYSAINGVGIAGVAVDAATCTSCGRCLERCLAAPELEETIRCAQADRAAGRRAVRSPHCTVCLDCISVCEHNGIVLHNRWRRIPGPARKP